MITNLYYYGYYLPNRINNYVGTPRKTSRTSPTTKTSDLSSTYSSFSKKTDEASFSLNKALNSQILNYANSLSKNINGLKSVSNSFLNQTESNDLEYDDLEETVSHSLSDFTGVINDFKKFSKKSGDQSKPIADFSDNIDSIVKENADTLGKLGVTVEDDGTLSFDKNTFKKKSVADLDGSVPKLRDMFQNVYDSTYDVMNLPMSDHMNFKDLNYYYNYNYSPVEANTFKIIETGMIVDIAV